MSYQVERILDKVFRLSELQKNGKAKNRRCMICKDWFYSTGRHHRHCSWCRKNLLVGKPIKSTSCKWNGFQLG